ncbi:FecR domain-containing protein [bacterium]|nr:FecR domain-containing protein [bacterium]
METAMRTTPDRGWFHALALAVLLALCPPAQSAEIVEGFLADVSGDVEVQKRGGKTWMRAYEGMRISPGDQISTGINGAAVLKIQDSKTSISPLTQFVVGRSIQSTTQVYTELFLSVGKVVSSVSKETGRENRFNVVTPTAVVGVRGTEQTVGHFPGIGTEANIRDGRGFAAPAPADALPAPVKAVLGISPSKLAEDGNGKDDKDKDKDKKKKKEKKKGSISDEGEETDKERGELSAEGGEAGPVTTELAVEEFNAWLDLFDQSLTPDAGVLDMGVLNDKTLEFVVPVDDGLRITIGDINNPDAFITTAVTQQADAQSDITPGGLSPAEAQEALTSIEAVDAPVSISVIEEQSTFAEVNEDVTQESTSQGGVPPGNTLVIPPGLPDLNTTNPP